MPSTDRSTITIGQFVVDFYLQLLVSSDVRVVGWDVILMKLFGYWRVNLSMINNSTQRGKKRRRMTDSLQVMLSIGVSYVLSPTIHTLSIFVIISLIVTVYWLKDIFFFRVYTNKNRVSNWCSSYINIE